MVVFDFGVHGQSLVANEDFQHILRVLNTNVDGKQKIMFALTSIKGIGRRFANIVCKKADVDMNKRFLCCSSSLVTYIKIILVVLIMTIVIGKQACDVCQSEGMLELCSIK